MANNVDALKPEIWTLAMQVPLRKTLVALEVCSVELQSQLTVGDVIHKGYHTDLSAENYTAGTALTAQTFNLSADDLSATTKKVVSFYVDDTERLQVKPDYAGQLAVEAAYRMKDAIDQDVLGEVSAGVAFGDSTATGSESFITATGVGSNTISAIAATTANIVTLFTKARKALRVKNVEEAGDWIAIMEPGKAALIEERVTIDGFTIADATLRNGYAGSFLGFKIYVSNNITSNRMYIGKRGAIDLVMQAAPRMEIKDVPDKIGKNFIAWTVYGQTVFTKNQSRFLDVTATD